MALKQEAKDKLKSLGFDVDKLIEAIKAEAETDVVVPEGTLLTEAQLTERDTNKLSEGKRTGESEGEKKGRELAAKAFRKKFGLEDTIGNDVEKVVEAVNTKLNKGDAALQEQIQALLRDKETLAQQITETETKAKQAQFESSLISMFPANRTQDLSDAERLALVKMNIEFVEDNGKTVAKKNGQIVTDKTTHAPLPINQVIADLFTEKKWTSQTPPAGGRGGGDHLGGSPLAGVKSASKFKEKWLAENPGKNEMSDEYVNALNKQAKEVGADFNMYA